MNAASYETASSLIEACECSAADKSSLAVSPLTGHLVGHILRNECKIAFVKAIENNTILFQTIEPRLAAEDSPALWQAALFVLSDELAQRQAEESRSGVWAMVVGVCSHWV